MKKNFTKRLISIVLVASSALVFSVSAFADQTAEGSTASQGNRRNWGFNMEKPSGQWSGEARGGEGFRVRMPDMEEGLAENFDPEELKASLLERHKARLDEMVAAGKMTQEEADKMYNDMAERIEGFEANLPRARAEGEENFAPRFNYRICDLDTIAELLGITPDELKAMVEEGKNPLEIIVETGKLEELKSLMLTTQKEVLDKMVENGKLTQEKADEMYEKAVENMENWDGTMPKMPDAPKTRFFEGEEGAKTELKLKFQDRNNKALEI